jgi:hypothetical protein
MAAYCLCPFIVFSCIYSALHLLLYIYRLFPRSLIALGHRALQHYGYSLLRWRKAVCIPLLMESKLLHGSLLLNICGGSCPAFALGTRATLRLLPQIQFTRREKLNRTPTDTSRTLTCYLHTPVSLNLAFLVIITLYILYYSDTVARTIDSNKRFSLSHAPPCALI